MLGELGVGAGCNGVLGVEGTFGVTAISGIICGPFMAVRQDSTWSFDGTNDDIGLVMRFFASELFDGDGPVVKVCAADGPVMKVFAAALVAVDGPVMKVFAAGLLAVDGPVRKVFDLDGSGLVRWL